MEDRMNFRFLGQPEPILFDEKHHNSFFDNSFIVSDRFYFNHIFLNRVSEDGKLIEDEDVEPEPIIEISDKHKYVEQLPFTEFHLFSQFNFDKYSDEISYKEISLLNSHLLFLYFELDFYVISDIFSPEYPEIKKDFLLNYGEILSFYTIDYFLSLISVSHLRNTLKKISNTSKKAQFLFLFNKPIPLQDNNFHIDYLHVRFRRTNSFLENINYFFFDKLKYTGEYLIPYQGNSEKSYRKEKESRNDSIIFFNVLKKFSIQTSFDNYPFFSFLYPIFHHFHLFIFLISNFEQNKFQIISSLKFDFFSLFSTYFKLKTNLIFNRNFSEQVSLRGRHHFLFVKKHTKKFKAVKRPFSRRKSKIFPFFRPPRNFLFFAPFSVTSSDIILFPLIHYLFSYFLSYQHLLTRKLVSRYLFSRLLFFIRENHEIIFNTIFINSSDVHFQDIF